MTKPSNLVVLSGRLVADPEVHNDRVASMRLAVDWSGQDATNKDQKTGFFTVKAFLGDDSPNQKFFSNQIRTGNFKKGTAVSIAGELRHEVWEKDGSKNSTVTVVVDSMQYAGFKQDGDGATNGAAAKESIEVPDAF